MLSFFLIFFIKIINLTYSTELAGGSLTECYHCRSFDCQNLSRKTCEAQIILKSKKDTFLRKHCECCGLVEFTELTERYLCISDKCVTHVRSTREHGNIVSQAVIRGCVLEGDWMKRNGFNHHPENEGEYACTCFGDKCNDGICGYKKRRKGISVGVSWLMAMSAVILLAVVVLVDCLWYYPKLKFQQH